MHPIEIYRFKPTKSKNTDTNYPIYLFDLIILHFLSLNFVIPARNTKLLDITFKSQTFLKRNN